MRNFKHVNIILATALLLGLSCEFSLAQNTKSTEGSNTERKEQKVGLRPSVSVGTSVMAGSGISGYSYGVEGSVPLTSPRRRRRASYAANFVYSHQSVGPWSASTVMGGPSMWMPLSDRLALSLDVKVGQQNVSMAPLRQERLAGASGTDFSRKVYDVNALLHYKLSEKADLYIGARITNMPTYNGFSNPYGLRNRGFGVPMGYGFGRNPYGYW